MAAPASIKSALTSMYKTVYMNRELTTQAKRKTPAYDSVQKMDDFDGDNIVFPFNDGLVTGVGPSVKTAQANVQSGTFDRWTMSTRKKVYGILTIDAESMLAARKDVAAFMRLKQKETNELLAYMKMVLGGHAFWGDGAGNLTRVGTVTGSDPVTSFTIPKQDAIKVQRKMLLHFNATRTGSPGTVRTSIYRVTKIERTFSATEARVTVERISGSGGANDPAANDYVYQKDFYDAFPLGVAAFIPAVAPGTGTVPGTLLGLDRTVDVETRSGWRVSWQGSIEETLKSLCATMGQYVDQENSVCWISHANWYRLEQELTAQNRKVIDARATQVFGSPALMILTPDGNIPVVRDPYLTNDVSYILDMSTIEVHHLGPVMGLTDEDGLQALRMTDEDGIEVRFRHMGENIIQRPFKCGRAEII